MRRSVCKRRKQCWTWKWRSSAQQEAIDAWSRKTILLQDPAVHFLHDQKRDSRVLLKQARRHSEFLDNKNFPVATSRSNFGCFLPRALPLEMRVLVDVRVHLPAPILGTCL